MKVVARGDGTAYQKRDDGSHKRLGPPKLNKADKKMLKRLKREARNNPEAFADKGRPVPPHRSGGAQVAGPRVELSMEVQPGPHGSNPGTPFDDFERRVCEIDECEHMGVCVGAEMALRHYTYEITLPPMTPEQRAWCLDEIGRVEGYTRSDFETADDKTLANGVLYAWADYARDKGVL